jgi:hypothetical protein
VSEPSVAFRRETARRVGRGGAEREMVEAEKSRFRD